jgi:xylulokinase
MNSILLGIDIGSSGCKVAAFSVNGTVLAQDNVEYNIYYPQPGWAEQNPEEWWRAVCKAIKQIMQSGRIKAKEIKGIGIDGQSWSAIAVNKKGEVLHNTPIWMDTRAKEICDEIARKIGEERLFETSGNPLQPSYTLPKILWYKKHLPDVYSKIDKILQSNSFIAFRLTGVYSQDSSQGYGYNCYDMRKGGWDKALCSELGVNPAFLPEIVPCHHVIGKVTTKAAEETGLTKDTPVVAGGIDCACGTLGVGVINPGQTQEQGGQAGGMSICIDSYKADKRLILSRHVVPGLWLLQGGTVGGGGVIKWFEKEFCAAEREIAARQGNSSYAEIDKEAEIINPGSDGMVFLPYMAGERSPIWDKNARGVYYGIDFSKTRAHFARASMEGVAYSLKHNIEVAESIGVKVKTLCAMGGAANSRLWTQIKSDVTGKHIVVPSSDTASALGAAILAGVGTGVYRDFSDAVNNTVHVKREHTPDLEKHKAYQKGYVIYRSLYNNLKSLMENQEINL